MILSDFIAKYTDQPVTFPDCPDGSCMCLMHMYLRDVLNIGDPAVLASPIAADLFTNFENLKGHEQFSITANTPDGVPATGDLVIFGANEAAGIPQGHVCVFRDGNPNAFYSFDANFPTGSTPHIQEHNYTDVVGWLHFTGEVAGQTTTPTDNTYKGLDLTNEASVKAAVDTWDEVANQGLFVRKADVETQVNDLKTQVAALTNHSTELQKTLDASKPAEGAVTVTPEVKQSILDKIAAIGQEIAEKLAGQ